MKQITFSRIFLFLPFLLLFGCSSGKQAVAFTKELEDAITTDNWVFFAQQSNPQFNNNRSLDAGYEVRCGKGKLQSYLPYYGRSYSGTGAYANQSPLDFKTDAFTVTKERGRRNSWVLVIRPEGVSDIREYRMTVFSNGSASLDIQMNTRSPMNFTGRLEVGR
mgnify:FL=1